jgi:hypothetical protein
LKRRLNHARKNHRDIFAHHLYTHFQVGGEATHLAALELVEANATPAPPGYEAFSIVFRGPSDRLIPQGMHRFHHDAIGTFDLFTVPIRRDQHGLYYEAVFNRRREER